MHESPALHDADGWIDFEDAGSSYYYSWTRMTATGTIAAGGDDALISVEGEAWFDHQWGDFIAVGGGGWDWFAVNLDDGTDLTLSLVRAADGSYPLVYGTLVRPDGSYEHLPRDAFTVTPLDEWTSARTGATYPSGWRDRPPRRAARDQPHADRARPGARHSRHDRRRLLGGLAARRGDARRLPAEWRWLRRADRLRALVRVRAA